jgi:hypothetical protein
MSHTPDREARVRSSYAPAPARSALSRVGPLLLASLLGLAACGDSGSDAGNTAAAPAGQTAGAAGGGSAPSRDEVEVTLSGGPHAGAHAAQADLNCFADGSGWSAGTGLMSDRRTGMTEVGTMLSGVPGSGGATEQVDLTIQFGHIDEDSPELGMAGLGGVFGGTGRGTVERQGRGAVIQVTGTAQDGTPISASFRCASVETI